MAVTLPTVSLGGLLVNDEDVRYQFPVDATETTLFTLERFDNSGAVFNFQSNVTNAHGVAWDGTHIWVLDNDNVTVEQFDTSGTLVATHTMTGFTDAIDIMYHSNTICVLNGELDNNFVKRYSTADFSEISTYNNPSLNTNLGEICSIDDANGDFLVKGLITGSLYFLNFNDGTYREETLTNAPNTPDSIAYYDGKFYVSAGEANDPTLMRFSGTTYDYEGQFSLFAGANSYFDYNDSLDQWVVMAADSVRTVRSYDLVSDFPTDLASMDSVTLEIQARIDTAGTDDTYRLRTKLTQADGANLAGGVTTSSVVTVNDFTGNSTTDQTFTVSNLDNLIDSTGQSYEVWRRAVLFLQQTHSANMGSDGARIEVDYVDVNGTYTSVPPDEPVIVSPTDGASIDQDTTINLEATVSDIGGQDVYAVWELWSTGTQGDVLDSFSTPSTSSSDVSHDGTNLWHSDYNTDTIYKLDPSDGSVLDSFSSPGATPLGISHDGTNLWNVDGSTDTIYKLDPSDGSVLDSFSSPSTVPQGISHDGTNLWHSDGNTGTIYKLDPADGSVLDSFSSPSNAPRGLSHDGTNLWHVDGTTNTIYKLDPSDGSVLDSFSPPGSGPSGVSHDGTSLWHVDLFSNLIYKLYVDALVQDITENTTPVTSGSSHITSWNTTGVALETYTLRAWAVDTEAQLSTTYDFHTVSIVAGNEPPNKPTIVTPTEGSTESSPVSIEITYSDPDGDPQAQVSIRRVVQL